jgi:hypothetical protein
MFFVANAPSPDYVRIAQKKAFVTPNNWGFLVDIAYSLTLSYFGRSASLNLA